VDHQARAASWAWWATYCAAVAVDPYLRRMSKQTQQWLLLAFAARVRTGYFGRGKQVQQQSVEKALRHVGQALLLAGFPDPRRSYGAKELDLAFRHTLKSLKEADPVPKPQLALPVETIAAAAVPAQSPGASARARAVADLIVIAFFFLLRVGEYTLPAAHRHTRTVQFRCEDVRFWKNGRLLPHTSPLLLLCSADQVVLTIDNQKNGHRGEAINHHKVHGPLDPVTPLARRVKAIYAHNMPPSTPLSYVSPGVHVVAGDILVAVRAAAVRSNLPAKGYKLDRIGAHSLRASGAMALRLNNYSGDEIMKIGRWRCTTFLTYIHSQIGALNAGVATKMARMISFINVAGAAA
jgi:hypothetical protein